MSTSTSTSTVKKKVATAGLTALLLAGGVAAFAYWTAAGSGQGSATTGDNDPVTIVQTATVADLQPGSPAQTLSGTFTNPNPGPVHVTSVTVAISDVTRAAGAPAGTCDASDYTLTGATMQVGNEVPAGTSQGSWGGATIAFNNKADVNQDACKGATVDLSYTSN